MQTSSKNATNRFLFTLLVATAVIPLPAMTPALLSGALGAMSVITAAGAEPARFVPVYFVPTRPGRAAPAMVPDTVLLGLAEPRTIVNEIGVDRGLAFEPLNPMPVVAGFDRPAWTWPIPRPGGGGVGGGRDVGFPSPVPEPATWAMMITGFLFSGLFLRRRRRSLAAA